MNGFEGLNSLMPMNNEVNPMSGLEPATKNTGIWENLMSVILESEMGSIDTEANLDDSLKDILRRQT